MYYKRDWSIHRRDPINGPLNNTQNLPTELRSTHRAARLLLAAEHGSPRPRHKRRPRDLLPAVAEAHNGGHNRQPMRRDRLPVAVRRGRHVHHKRDQELPEPGRPGAPLGHLERVVRNPTARQRPEQGQHRVARSQPHCSRER